LLGQGDGTFSFVDTLASIGGEPTTSLTAADFDRDGNLDLAAASTLSGVTPSISLGYGHGAFNVVSQNVEVSANSSAAGDFNGDGILDLVLGGTGFSDAGNGGRSSVLLGSGDGTFTLGFSPTANGFVAVGDFNADGKLDIAFADPQNNNVTIFLGNGNGTFTTAQGSPMPVGKDPQAILTADFNNDGKLDLAIANSADGTITLLLGNGDGTFTPSAGSPYLVGPGASALAAADFNGDGKLDLAVVSNLDVTGAVSILLQQ
jgi:hypothetical protein